ncbi:hypothetical protein SK128_023278, partial [Halocaridina rubra]
MLYRLDHVRLPSGTRPSPPSENFSSVDPEAWLAASEVRKNAKSQNNAWLLS